MTKFEDDPAKIAALRGRLLAWYAEYARDLPWRKSADPYAIWVSEIMLQQTRVAVVVDRYQKFMQRFPTAVALALAPEQEVLALWSGLGYYRRARLLHKAAQFVPRTGAAIFRCGPKSCSFCRASAPIPPPRWPASRAASR